MAQQIPLAPDVRAPETERHSLHEIAPDLSYLRLAIVNVVLFGEANARSGEWVLIDAGLPGTAGMIAEAAESRFGAGARPAAILLTHGHFDHVGALETLAAQWDVPIYAHPLELPYLDGRSAYPPADPTVGGGLMAALSPLYPSGPIDVSRWLQPLPADGSVSGMPGWRWLPTPGHSPGHVSFWREADRALVVGDAFVTTAQESVYAAITQRMELHGPPMYYTPDWDSARQSVEMLSELKPELAVTGHGRAVKGPGLRQALYELARDFDHIAVPNYGRYVGHPTRADR